MACQLSSAPGVTLESVDSTNTEARRRFEATGRAVWVRAERQTQGRGRRARAWISEPGNLYASVCFSPALAPARFGEVAFVTALALRDAIVRVCPDAAPALRLKWPNDLVCAQGKLAGILLEGESGGSTPVLTVGWGVNCAHSPRTEGYPATSLRALGHALAPQELLEALRDTFARRYAELEEGGMDAVLPAWACACARTRRTDSRQP